MNKYYIRRNKNKEIMKGTIELPIIALATQKLCKPTLEEVNDTITIQWKYQCTSWSCQGEWSTYEVCYKKENFNFNEAMNLLTNFIKSEYKL